MTVDKEQEIQRWMAKRRSALIISIQEKALHNECRLQGHAERSYREPARCE